MNGKLTCKMLKSVRKQIADANNIDYEPRVCHFEGNCRGTCPACEAEMRYLESQLSLRQAAGKVIKIVGLATGISAAMASCISQPTDAPAVGGDTIIDSTMENPASLAPALDSDTVVVDTVAISSTQSSTPKRNRKSQPDEHEIIFEGHVGGGYGPSDPKPEEHSDTEEEKDLIADDDSTVYTKVQEKAQYPGGVETIKAFIAANLKYPKSAREIGTQGSVIVDFVIEKDGSVSGVNIARSIDPALDQEAMRIVKLMNSWIPAKIGSKIVRSRFRLPVNFRLRLH